MPEHVQASQRESGAAFREGLEFVAAVIGGRGLAGGRCAAVVVEV